VYVPRWSCVCTEPEWSPIPIVKQPAADGFSNLALTEAPSAPVEANPGARPAAPESLPNFTSQVAPNSDLPGTILSIQILRFVAAFGVVIFHAHIALVRNLFNHIPGRVDRAFGIGASGVHIFFVISGFVMVYTTLRSRLTPGAFLSRRFIRVFPIYWLLAAAYLIAHLFVGIPYHLSLAEVLGAALLLPHASSLVIGPGWTLSFEMYFYVCFALALYAGLARGLLLLSILYVTSVAAGLIFAPHSLLARFASDSLLLEFIAGAWLAFAFERGLTIGPRIGSWLLATGLALFATGLWIDYARVPSVVCWGIPSLLLVAGGLAFEPKLASRLGRSTAKLGDSSYLLYLSHILLIDLVAATSLAVLNNSDSAAAYLSIPLAVTCTIAAAVGYEWIERPLLNVTKRWLLPKKSELGHEERGHSFVRTAKKSDHPLEFPDRDLMRVSADRATDHQA